MIIPAPVHTTTRSTRSTGSVGRFLAVLGLAVAFSALWTTQFYPRQPGTSELTYVFRLAFGSGMAASTIIGFAEYVIRRHGSSRTISRWAIRATTMVGSS